MAGLLEYIKWRGDLDFKASPFNAVDNLILTKLSYLSFKGLLEDTEYNPLSEVGAKYLESNKEHSLGLLLSPEHITMLEEMHLTNRYGKLNIKECVEIYNEEVEIQFAAVTFELDEDTAYLAFRGTDDTILGWKEDFQMSFMDIVPAQKEALSCINRIGHIYKNLYVGGHSKGGNLAVYASIHADADVKTKIIHTYNNDGPGFKQSILDTDVYKEIQDRITTLVPQSSIVGMLLEHEETYRVIKCEQAGVMQHDGFSWEIEGPDFIYLSDVDKDSRMIDMTIKNVLNTMDDEQREAFTNIMFDMLSVNENRTLIDLKKDGFKSLHAMLKNYSNLDKETKKAISKMTSLFFEEGYRSFKEVNNADQWTLKHLNFKKKNKESENNTQSTNTLLDIE